MALRILFPCALALAVGAPAFAEQGDDVEPIVSGIGGFFFRSENPEALAAWYQENFEIDPAPKSYDKLPWRQKEGATVFAPFPADSSMFPDNKIFMINFRTSALDRLVARLRTNGVSVNLDKNAYPNGRFATLADPEGNPIQLWEPALPTK